MDVFNVKEEIKDNKKSQEYKGSCSGGDQDMDVTTIVYNSYYQVLKLFSVVFYTNHVFAVGSLVPDIQRPVVLLPPPLLAEHGGGAHEVLRQGNHYEVHIHQYH